MFGEGERYTTEKQRRVMNLINSTKWITTQRREIDRRVMNNKSGRSE